MLDITQQQKDNNPNIYAEDIVHTYASPMLAVSVSMSPY